MAMLLVSMTIMTTLAVATAEAQQVPDDSYNPPIANPAYAQNSGPVVAIDEAHYNFHTMESSPARFRPFATLLKRDGYRVRPSTSQFSAQSLQGVDILVIANPRAQSTAAQDPDYRLPTPSAFTDAEIEAVRTWVHNGGSLWLVADHMPWPGATEKLAAAFGIRTLNGYAMNEKVQDPDFYFRRSNSPELLTNHPITNGRTSTESVNKIVSFTGSAFQIDADRNAQPLLVFGPDVVSIMATRAWTWNSSTPRIPVGGGPQGAVMRAGQGRVAVFGEAAMFTAQKQRLQDGTWRRMGMNAPYAEQNYKFVLNVSHWLSGLLDNPAPPPADTTKPTITLTTPADGATYSFNQAVNASYSCQDEAGGSGLKSCQGTVANGSAIDTASAGSKTFTVTATDNAGNQDSVTQTYSVAGNQPPGDHGRIAFHTNRDGNYEVYTMDSDGSNPINLTNNPAVDEYAAVSPDGTKMVFDTNRNGNFEIYEMSLDGSNPTRLTNNPANDFSAAYSPEGTKIAFETTRDGNYEIYTMNSDGSNPINLTNNPARETNVLYSPVGTKLAFSTNRDGFPEVYTMNLDGSNPTNLTNTPCCSEVNIAYSPEGTKIAFSTNRNGNFEVYVMNSDGSNPTNLTRNSAADVHPAFSRDGKQIAFSTNRDGNYEVYTMDLDGSNPTRLTNSPSDDFGPDWLPTAPP